MDVIFVLTLLVLFAASLGLVALLARLGEQQ